MRQIPFVVAIVVALLSLCILIPALSLAKTMGGLP